METKIITRVNNVDIVATSDEQLVPIRPRYAMHWVLTTRFNGKS